jgi:hypothetical protein
LLYPVYPRTSYAPREQPGVEELAVEGVHPPCAPFASAWVQVHRRLNRLSLVETFLGEGVTVAMEKVGTTRASGRIVSVFNVSLAVHPSGNSATPNANAAQERHLMNA